MIEYFSMVGSYRGGIKLHGRWVSVCELNRIDKTGWKRHQGPLTAAQQRALRQKPIRAEVIRARFRN